MLRFLTASRPCSRINRVGGIIPQKSLQSLSLVSSKSSLISPSPSIFTYQRVKSSVSSSYEGTTEVLRKKTGEKLNLKRKEGVDQEILDRVVLRNPNLKDHLLKGKAFELEKETFLKVVKSCTTEQFVSVLKCMKDWLIAISKVDEGPTIIEALIKKLQTPQLKEEFLSNFRGRVMPLTESPNGSLVLQLFVKSFNFEDVSFLYQETVENLGKIASKTTGSSFIRVLYEVTQDEKRRKTILNKIIDDRSLTQSYSGNLLIESMISDLPNPLHRVQTMLKSKSGMQSLAKRLEDKDPVYADLFYQVLQGKGYPLLSSNISAPVSALVKILPEDRLLNIYNQVAPQLAQSATYKLEHHTEIALIKRLVQLEKHDLIDKLVQGKLELISKTSGGSKFVGDFASIGPYSYRLAVKELYPNMDTLAKHPIAVNTIMALVNQADYDYIAVLVHRLCVSSDFIELSKDTNAIWVLKKLLPMALSSVKALEFLKEAFQNDEVFHLCFHHVGYVSIKECLSIGFIRERIFNLVSQYFKELAIDPYGHHLMKSLYLYNSDIINSSLFSDPNQILLLVTNKYGFATLNSLESENNHIWNLLRSVLFNNYDILCNHELGHVALSKSIRSAANDSSYQQTEFVDKVIKNIQNVRKTRFGMDIITDCLGIASDEQRQQINQHMRRSHHHHR